MAESSHCKGLTSCIDRASYFVLMKRGFDLASLVVVKTTLP